MTGEPAPLSTDRQTGRDERSGADRCWIYRDGYHYAQVTFTKPDKRLYPTAVEYMRVLSRSEVEKLANDREGVDVMQMVNSQLRTIEGQRKHIAQLQERIAMLTRESAAVADAYLNKMGIDPEELTS